MILAESSSHGGKQESEMEMKRKRRRGEEKGLKPAGWATCGQNCRNLGRSE
jgi:hypothetical protein